MEFREITEDRFIECMAIDFPNFKISKSNLTHPTSQFVVSFYTLMLHNAIELNDPDEIWNVTENQRCYINSHNPEAVSFTQHVWIHNLHSAIKYVFNHLSENGSEFVYSDILFPENTPRRSFVFMALMLNFYWYSIDFTHDLESDISACVEKVQLLQQSKAEKEKYTAQLRELEFQRCQYVELYKDKKKQIKDNSEANEEKEILMKELLIDEERTQKDLDTVEKEQEQLQAALTQIQNKKEYYESLIVSNENQVRDIHEKHRIKKDECVEKMKLLEKQVKEASHTLARSQKVLELQQRLNGVVRDEKTTVPESKEKKQKGFQELHNCILNSTAKKDKLAEEEESLAKKILEAQEALLKSQNEEQNLDREEKDILTKVKGLKIKSNIGELKKNHSQLEAKMGKESENTEEIVTSIADIQAKYKKLEMEIKSIDTTNKEKYKNYENEMSLVFDILEDSFNIQKKDISLK